jgi:endonuclease/exonuclease/phosphatase family metal-dependent hydrolase
MKIVTLNIWGGKIYDDLLKFISSNASVDVFCFQEIYKDGAEFFKNTKYKDDRHDIYYDLQKLLPDHVGVYHPALGEYYGVAMFIHKDYEIKKTGDVFIYRERGHIPEGDMGRHARNLQYATVVKAGEEPITVVNVHGLWNGQGKSDTEERIEQSQRIVDFIRGLDTKIVLCGDFNLRLDTKSLTMIEATGLRNLIKEYSVPTTRTSLYGKPETHADYVFVSPEIKEKKFLVMPDVVSDHAPLQIDI